MKQLVIRERAETRDTRERESWNIQVARDTDEPTASVAILLVC